MSSSNCCFLTCLQISQEAGNVVWYSHLFKNFSQFVVIHTVKGFSVVSEAEVDIFLEFSCFFSSPVDVGNLISGPSCLFEIQLEYLKFSVHILLMPSLENFEYNFASIWNECNCVVVWSFFGIAPLWNWNENWPFPVLCPLLSFPNLLAYWVQHFNSIIFQDLKQLNWNSIISMSFLCSLFPKAQLTSCSKTSVFRWAITALWVSGSLRSLSLSFLGGIVLYILATSSYSLLLLLDPYSFNILLWPSLHEIFPWCIYFSWRDL